MKLVDVAMTQVGQKEDPVGSNWGVPVKSYLASVGIDFPASWCMAFVYWCAEQAGIRVADGTGGLMNPLYKTGGVLQQWNKIDGWNQLNRLKLRYDTPEPGDIFIMDFGQGLGHCGIVKDVEETLLRTIEGNTNDTGGREGFEVCVKVRQIKSCLGFIRLPPGT